MKMLRFIKQLFGCSRRRKIVDQSLTEHRYASQRVLNELHRETRAVELLVTGLQRDILK